MLMIWVLRQIEGEKRRDRRKTKSSDACRLLLLHIIIWKPLFFVRGELAKERKEKKKKRKSFVSRCEGETCTHYTLMLWTDEQTLLCRLSSNTKTKRGLISSGCVKLIKPSASVGVHIMKMNEGS